MTGREESPLGIGVPDSATLDVDPDGVILASAGQPAELLGAETPDLVGRNLFSEVAPALGVPACLGRFRDGLRGGALDETFTFILGRLSGAIELRISMRSSDSAGPVRIGLDALRSFPPSRQREAMLAVDQRANAEPVDPGICEREPIHVPGSIQPPAALLGAHPATFRVEVVSQDFADLTGLPGAELGHALDDVLPSPFLEELRGALADGTIGSAPVRYDVDLGAPAQPFSVAVHLHDDRLILEFEPAPLRPGEFGVPSHGALRDAVRLLRRESEADALLNRAAVLVRRLTGYERVLVYRFDPDWNGEAVAEAIVDDWHESLVGLRFPASDIPRQARELYTRSPARYVIDRDAAPIPLLAAAGDNRAVDLTHATMRSLSPVHIEYQRNLGVNGSMSAAIIVGGRLWGLVIGHHRRPHYVAPATRDAVAVVADALALRIEDLERAKVAREQASSLDLQLVLLAQMAGSDDPVGALARGRPRLTDLFGATGAALVLDGVATPVGSAPSPAALLDLAARLSGDLSVGRAFATDHLSAVHGPASLYADVASGVLAAFIDRGRGDLLMWFRPEQVRTLVWGGDPRKTVLAESRSMAVLPRRSFERWAEERRGLSEPWAPWHVDVATALAGAVDRMALRSSRRIAELSAQQDELLGALAAKDLLVREIDHRVKNSLQIVGSFLRMQSRQVADPDAQAAFSDTYGRVMSIARVHDSLYQSSDLTEVDLGHTIEALCRDLASVGGEQRELELKAEHGLMVPYRKAVALCLIATELVTNAWKYAYPGQTSGLVEVVLKRDGPDLKLRVCDEGEGLPADWEAAKGLGMKLVRAMLAQIDAHLEVVETRRGACFTVVC